MSDNKKRLLFFIIALIVAVIWMLSPDKMEEEENKYFSKLNLVVVTGVVKTVIVTNNHNYGVVYIQNIKSNKNDGYETSFQNDYLFCKIGTDQAILVSPGISEMQVNDRISLNTNSRKYLVYRNGRVINELGPDINPDDGLYEKLKNSGYLDFYYYHRNK